MNYTINLDMPFDLRRQLLASRKPYETFDDVLRRVCAAAFAAQQPAPRTRILKRSTKRWPLCLTGKQWYERDLARFIAECRASGYTDTDADLAEMFDDEAAMSADDVPTTEWRCSDDANIDKLFNLVMRDIHAMEKGAQFELRAFFIGICPQANKWPHSAYSRVLRPLHRALLASPQFVRAVTAGDDDASANIFTKL